MVYYFEHLAFSADEDIQDAQIYIVTVPTPIDPVNRPDLKPLRAASKTVGTVLKNDIVIFGSTVFLEQQKRYAFNIEKQWLVQ